MDWTAGLAGILASYTFTTCASCAQDQTMRPDQKSADEMSIRELEALIARKKLEARQARLLRVRQTGRIVIPDSADRERQLPEGSHFNPNQGGTARNRDRRQRSVVWRTGNRVLLLAEIGAVLGIVFILFTGFQSLQILNRETADLQFGLPPTPTAVIRAVVLPSGHTPPTTLGGAQYNQQEIPLHLRPIAQSQSSILIPTPGTEQARRIFIPALWDSPAPVVQGDGWEQLKKGVAQHIGSANPGEAGNIVLSAHNDIYGELFRDLDRLGPGDEIKIYTATGEYLYRVTGIRIVEPTETSVMDSTARPPVTLISCYPYLIDTQRIVVFGEIVTA